MFQRLIAALLDVSDRETDSWGDIHGIIPKPQRRSEWFAAKGAVDRHAARAARAFQEAGVVIEWKRKSANAASPEYFGTIGVSSNIIDATWQALVDGYEYHLIHAAEASGEAPADTSTVEA